MTEWSPNHFCRFVLLRRGVRFLGHGILALGGRRFPRWLGDSSFPESVGGSPLALLSKSQAKKRTGRSLTIVRSGLPSRNPIRSWSAQKRRYAPSIPPLKPLTPLPHLFQQTVRVRGAISAPAGAACRTALTASDQVSLESPKNVSGPTLLDSVSASRNRPATYCLIRGGSGLPSVEEVRRLAGWIPHRNPSSPGRSAVNRLHLPVDSRVTATPSLSGGQPLVTWLGIAAIPKTR